jgi:hypothetical protein
MSTSSSTVCHGGASRLRQTAGPAIEAAGGRLLALGGARPCHIIPRHQPHTWSLGGKNGMLVSINMDTGETTFGAGYNDPSEAARVFWEEPSLVLFVGPSPRNMRHLVPGIKPSLDVTKATT